MKNKIISLGLFISLIFLFGCIIGPNPPDNLYYYKGINVPKDSIPDKCWDKVDCEMFDCMVDSCWCKEMFPEGGILYESKVSVLDENSAKSIVMQYLDSKSINYDKNSVKAVKLNALFYNVFYDVDGSEDVLTISIDGVIMKTECGV